MKLEFEMKCYIDDIECEYASDAGDGEVECVAVFEEQCPLNKKERRINNSKEAVT